MENVNKVREEDLWYIRDLEILIERYKTVGARHPVKMYTFLPPDHPYSQAHIKWLESSLKLKKREITVDECDEIQSKLEEEMRKWERKFEEEESLKRGEGKWK
jgi:hypothetical protein